MRAVEQRSLNETVVLSVLAMLRGIAAITKLHFSKTEELVCHVYRELTWNLMLECHVHGWTCSEQTLDHVNEHLFFFLCAVLELNCSTQM